MYKKSSHTIASVTIENRNDRLYFVISGRYNGYTEADFDMDIQVNSGSWSKTEVTPEVVLDRENGTQVVVLNVY